MYYEHIQLRVMNQKQIHKGHFCKMNTTSECGITLPWKIFREIDYQYQTVKSWFHESFGKKS